MPTPTDCVSALLDKANDRKISDDKTALAVLDLADAIRLLAADVAGIKAWQHYDEGPVDDDDDDEPAPQAPAPPAAAETIKLHPKRCDDPNCTLGCRDGTWPTPPANAGGGEFIRTEREAWGHANVTLEARATAAESEAAALRAKLEEEQGHADRFRTLARERGDELSRMARTLDAIIKEAGKLRTELAARDRRIEEAERVASAAEAFYRTSERRNLEQALAAWDEKATKGESA